jgi:hypothetical protein
MREELMHMTHKKRRFLMLFCILWHVLCCTLWHVLRLICIKRNNVICVDSSFTSTQELLIDTWLGCWNHFIKWRSFLLYVSVIKILISFYSYLVFIDVSNQMVYFYYYKFYCNIKYNVGSHTKEHNRCTQVDMSLRNCCCLSLAKDLFID